MCKPLQCWSFDQQPIRRHRLGCCVHPRVRHVTQPARHSRIGRMFVGCDTGLPQGCNKWHPETALQVTDEALNFALRLRPVGLAQARQNANMLGIIEEARMEAMHAAPIGVALQHDGFHVVVKHLGWHATKCQKGAFVTGDQRLDPLVVTELDVSRPAPPQRRDEHLEFVRPTSDVRPICLHLLTRFSLEPDNRLNRGQRHKTRHEHLQARHAASVTAGLDLTQQHSRWNPVWCRSRKPFDDVDLVGIELLRTLRTRLSHRRILAAPQVAPDRIARSPRRTAQSPYPRAMLLQNNQFHLFLRLQHRSLHIGGTT